jgi:hypothetical protein
MEYGEKAMQLAMERTGRDEVLRRPARLADPTRGVGQALRAAYLPLKSDLPQEIQTLLDRLD